MNLSPSPMRQVVLIAFAAVVMRALAFAGLELYADEAYYWTWTLRPAGGYFDHPPMVAWLIALFSFIPGEFGVRAAFLLLGGVAVILTGLLARELTSDPRAPVIAALLTATMPLLQLTGGLALPDAPVVAAYVLATWMACRVRGPGWILLGVVVGLGLLSKYTAALFGPAMLLLVPFDRDLRQQLRTIWPWLGGVTAFVVFAPTLVWNAQHDWSSLRFQLGHGFNKQGSAAIFFEYVGGQLGAVGPIVLVIGLLALVRLRDEKLRRVAFLTLVPLAVTTWSATRGKVEANWPAPVYPGLAAAAAVWLVTVRPKVRTGLVGASVALALLAFAFYAVELRGPWVIDPRSPAIERFQGWRDLASQLRERAGDDPFVFASNYQEAAGLAYYAGWRRFGPTHGRISQFDLWNDAPQEGEPFWILDKKTADGWPPAAPHGRAEDAVELSARIDGKVIRRVLLRWVESVGDVAHLGEEGPALGPAGDDPHVQLEPDAATE